jgi:putative molybdopterin biosynthesis protein
MKKFLSTREVSKLLGINEKLVYSLISEKGLPATKVTGKWLFPQDLVEQWVENGTLNYPKFSPSDTTHRDVLVIAGSNDPLLDRTITLFNRNCPEHLAVFGNLGSMGGLRALRRNLCHIASSHLLQENENEYNFEFVAEQFEKMPAVINFCRRQQGLLLQKGNPKNIIDINDLAREGIRIANRPLGTGTRLLLDRELGKAGIRGDRLEGYHAEFDRHIDVGLEVLSGRADVAPAIQPVASLLGLDFLPIRWERYDLLITKEKFFEQGVQQFLGLLTEDEFRHLAESLEGYDASLSGRMVFQQHPLDNSIVEEVPGDTTSP